MLGRPNKYWLYRLLPFMQWNIWWIANPPVPT